MSEPWQLDDSQPTGEFLPKRRHSRVFVTEQEVGITTHLNLLNRSLAMQALLFAIALASRLGFLVWRGPLVAPDTRSYLRVAHNIVTYGTYSLDGAPPITPSVWWPPLYPAFLTVFEWLGAPLVTIAVIQAAIGGLCAVLVFELARMAMPLKWAAMAGIVYSIHPGAISAASWILTETLFTFLLLFGILALARGLTRNRWWLTALSGSLLALATLCRSITLLLPFGLLAIVWLFPGLVSRFRHGLLFIGFFLLVIAPWSIRSTLVAGRFIPVQDPGSAALLFYTATRTDWDQKDQERLWSRLDLEQLRAVAVERGEPGAQEMPVHRLLFREGLRNIRASPLTYIAGRARTYPYFFLTSYDSFTGLNRSLGTLLAERDLLRLGGKLCLLLVFSLIPFILGIVALGKSRTNLAAALAASVWVYMWLVYLPLWIEPRYWLPAVPFLLVSAVFGLRVALIRLGMKLES